MSIQKSLKNAMLTGAGLISWQNNAPTQYNDRQHQYFSAETRTFTQKMLKYASDFVQAQVQGLNPEDPYEWQTRGIRMAELVQPTAAIQRDFDDYKMIIFEDRDIEYVMPGAKIVALGSTWLVMNPMNMSGSDGAGVIRRCNSVWNFIDYYGNVISEPILVENTRANANDGDAQQSLLINKGYFNVICQYNDYTRQIDTNTRMILGTSAYRVTGYSDFDMEYTGDYNSVRTLSFSVRYEESNDAIDDMVNHVAGGKSFSWDVMLTDWATTIQAGQTKAFTAASVRNGIPVTGSTENPISYLWESSDESVLTVDEDGIVTAVAEGYAQITATLEQNPSHSETVGVNVTSVTDGVFFTSTPPDALGSYESVTVSAAYFDDGAETADALTWTLTGADETAYSYTEAQDGKSVTVRCFGYSEKPLVITAGANGFDAVVKIRLEGI